MHLGFEFTINNSRFVSNRQERNSASTAYALQRIQNTGYGRPIRKEQKRILTLLQFRTMKKGYRNLNYPKQPDRILEK